MHENYMKQDIAEAYLALTKEKAFDKVSATEIVKKCGISRQTFYYHFKDVMDVAEFALKMQIDQVAQKASECSDYKEAISIYVIKIREYKKIYINMFSSRQKDTLTSYMLQNLKHLLMGIFDLNPTSQADRTKFINYIDFYSYGILGIILEKIIGTDAPDEAIVAEIYEILSWNIKMFYKE